MEASCGPKKTVKVIITGATGFVGRNLAERLYEYGYYVMATGRDTQVGRSLSARGINFRSADILSSESLEKAFSPADCVIHCAAKTGDWGSKNDFYQTNLIGTRHVAQACRRHHIQRIIFISTPSIYVDGKDRLNIRESEPLPARQLTHYAMTKLLAEKELFALSKQGFEVIVFRPRAVYGPHDKNFLPRILRMAEKKRFTLIAGGKALVDVTYIANLVELVHTAINAPPNAWNQAYNVSNGDPLSIASWFELMLGMLGTPFRPKSIPENVAWLIAALNELATHIPLGPKRPIMTRFSVGYMARSMTLSIEKAARMLGYRPPYSTRSSFEDYARRLSLL